MAEKCGLGGRSACDFTREMTSEEHHKTEDFGTMAAKELVRKLMLEVPNCIMHPATHHLTQEEAQTFFDMVHQTEKAKKTFTLNDIEYADAVKFAEKHIRCMSKSATSEKFEYTFVPCGIGTAKAIKCLICGKQENITDFGCW
jgi:hypothetical protein